jgi:hypothetical protein
MAWQGILGLASAMTSPSRPSLAHKRKLEAYWRERREQILGARRSLWARRLDRDRVLEAGSCFFTGLVLFREAVELLLVEEDARALTFLDSAEFYLQTAIERDDLSHYGHIGQHDLGRSVRLRNLVLVRWIRYGRLEFEAFALACDMKRKWNEMIFSASDWRSSGFSLAEWIAEELILANLQEASRICGEFVRPDQSLGGRAKQRPEWVLWLVVAHLQDPRDDGRRSVAERALDELYGQITDWMGRPGDDEILHDERLLYAYVRAKYFKNQENPIRIIKMMRLGE